MKPLARITDPTTDKLLPGAITGPGAPQVLSHGLSAARVLDTAACGFPPHPPGSIQTGVADVLIHGLPATGVMDTVVCGAQITVGSPMVLIGGAAVTIPLNIQGSDDFVKKTQAAVATLYGTATGRKIFADIAASGHLITVVPTEDANGYCDVPFDPLNDVQTPGKGASSIVRWNPDHPGQGLEGHPDGPTVILGHELVHAHHNATGTNGNGPEDSYPTQRGSSSRGEERKTVGCAGGTIKQPDGTPATVPDHSHDVPTENSLRRELGLPLRKTYYPPTFRHGPPW